MQLRRFIFTFALLTGLSTFSYAAPVPEISPQIVAKINGRTISTLDVTRQLDRIFNKEFPKFQHVPEARYEFYTLHWKMFVKEMIEKELILTEAESKGMPVSDSDIRQELDEVFGPNIYQSLEKSGISYNDAWAIVRRDILVRRMTMYRVSSKAKQSITPKSVIKAYTEFKKTNKREKEWEYQLLSIKGKTEEQTQKLLKKATTLIGVRDSLTGLHQSLIRNNEELSQALYLSDPLIRKDNAISKGHLSVLENLQEGEISPPQEQVSRASKKIVYRIFHLKKVSKEQEIPFEEVARQLENQLFQQKVKEETKLYIERLYAEYHVEKLSTEAPPFTKLEALL